MFSRRTDLPLDQDALGRFLPWLVAFMVFLAALAQAGLITLDQLAQRWDTGMATTLSVQIPADPQGNEGASTRRVQAVLNMLSETPGVVRARIVSDAKVLQLLSPWLGSANIADVPLPRLIDVKTDPSVNVDVRVLQRRLADVVPGVQVDDHGVWLARLIALVRTLEGLAFGVMMLIFIAASATVVFATRTGLTVHADAIEVLHLTGAHDSYIAGQFAGRALRLGFKGGLYGLGLAGPTLLVLGYVAGRMDERLVPNLALPVLGWVSLAGLPLAAALVAGLTARITVLRNLKRML